MGKARITAHVGGGLYNVDILADNGDITDQIVRLNAEITDANAQIVALNSELVTLASQEALSEGALNSAIISGDTDAIDAAVGALAEKRANIATKNRELLTQKGRLLSAEKNLQYYLGARVDEEAAQIWAADFSTELSGEVGTIELGRDGDETPIIYPAGEGGTGSEYDDQRDGTRQTPLANSGAGASYNYGISLGLTKWKPRYRFGVITSLDGGLADIALDPYVREGVDMNITDTLLDVPIDYLDCDAAAFVGSDPVVIEFTDYDWGQPKLIGFVNNPRPCTPQYAVFSARQTASTRYYTVWDIKAGAVATLTDPISGGPIALPATQATLQNWLDAQEQVTADGALYDVTEQTGVAFPAPTVTYGPIDPRCSEYRDMQTEAYVTETASAPGALFTGEATLTSACNYRVAHSINVDNFDINITLNELARGFGTPQSVNMSPARYDVATTAGAGGSYVLQVGLNGAATTDTACSHGTRINFPLTQYHRDEGLWNGSFDFEIDTPIGAMTGLSEREYVNFLANYFSATSRHGYARLLAATTGTRIAQRASGAAVQIFVEIGEYSFRGAVGEVDPGLGFAVIAAVDSYPVSADSVDPLTQTSNPTFTAAIDACVRAAFTVAAGSMSLAFYK